MKKGLFTICAVLPGGFVLLATMMLFVSCSHFQAQSQGFRIEGRTGSPETIMLADAEAYATKRCADDPQKCYMGMRGSNFMDTTAGVTWAGIQAAGAYSRQSDPAIAPSQTKDKDAQELKKNIVELKTSQKALGNALREMNKRR
jgi:hypothetical protein